MTPTPAPTRPEADLLRRAACDTALAELRAVRARLAAVRDSLRPPAAERDEFYSAPAVLAVLISIDKVEDAIGHLERLRKRLGR